MPKCRQVSAAFLPCSSYQSIMRSRCFASLESSRARTALTARGMFSQKFLIPAITHVYGIYLNEITAALFHDLAVGGAGGAAGESPRPRQAEACPSEGGKRGSEPAPEPGTDEALLHPAPEEARPAHLQLRLRLREEVALDVGGLPKASLQEAGALAAEGPACTAVADLGGDVAGYHLRLTVGEHARLRQHLAVGQRHRRHVPHRVYALERRRQGVAVHLHPTALLGEAGFTHDRRHLVERHADQEVVGGFGTVLER